MSFDFNIVFYTVIALFCLLNWLGAFLENRKLYAFTKPLVLLALILFFAYNGGFSERRLPFLIALVLSMAGDIFLIFHNQKSFMAGMAAFALAHLFYIYGFSMHPSRPLGVTIGAIVLVLIVGAFSYFVDIYGKDSPVPDFEKRLFKLYGMLVGGMAIVAWMCLFRPGWTTGHALMAGLGGTLFVLSDFLIALEQLGKRFFKPTFLVIVTYHIAQILIVASVLGMTRGV